MTPQELLLVVFCPIADLRNSLGLGRLRQRGAAPKLSDSEVITIEVVGEFWGLDADRELLLHFRQDHTGEFPALAHVSRTTFVRQAANLWRVKHLIPSRLAAWLCGNDPRWLVDSLPIDACQFARAPSCRRFAGMADHGYDHLRKFSSGSRWAWRGPRDCRPAGTLGHGPALVKPSPGRSDHGPGGLS